MSQQHPDEELIRRTLAGDQSAFAELVRRYQRRIAVTARSVIGEMAREELADVVQDIFLLIFRALPSFRGESQFGTYVTRIALRHCYRELKRRRKRRFMFFSYDAADEQSKGRGSFTDRVGSGAEDVADRPMIADERRNAVIEAMARLPEEFRSVLALRIVEDLSVEEVAEALNISTGTVKSRLYRAKEKMRELLSGIEDLEFEM